MLHQVNKWQYGPKKECQVAGTPAEILVRLMIPFCLIKGGFPQSAQLNTSRAVPSAWNGGVAWLVMGLEPRANAVPYWRRRSRTI